MYQCADTYIYKLESEIEALKQQISDLKASLPKVRAEAVRDAAEACNLYISGAGMTNHYVNVMKYADKLEAGNE